MSRQLATEVEITKMIHDRIREGRELDGDCRNVTITSVYRHEEDESGCNWEPMACKVGPLDIDKGCSKRFPVHGGCDIDGGICADSPSQDVFRCADIYVALEV